VPEGTIQVERLPDARAFLEAAGPYLERREAEHNLLFGIAANLITDPDRPMTAPPLFAVIRRAGEVVAAALMTPPFNVVLSWTDDPDAIPAIAGELTRARLDIPGITAPPEIAQAFAKAWAGPRGQVAERTMAERIYRLEQVTPPRGVPDTIASSCAPGRMRSCSRRWVGPTRRKPGTWSTVRSGPARGPSTSGSTMDGRSRWPG
jgi:hypothetical protein